MESIYLNGYFHKKSLHDFCSAASSICLCSFKLLKYFHTTEYFSLKVFGSNIFPVFPPNFILRKFFSSDSKAGSWRFFVEKVFLVVPQNSQKNTCAKVSFLITLQACNLLKERLWHRCFPGNFAKFLRVTFSIKAIRWLLLLIFQLRFFYPMS